ncbi:MAG TPA: hypothetical protein VJU86_02360 [Pyrinomonadaceae bacterium]|nr:hypothetical protein [Pyrinomonadaceae bacterium]
MTKDELFKEVFVQLRGDGFLLESDPKLPSVCSLIAGEPMRGSWWSHPMAQTIFQVNEKLEDHPDVLITKLVSGKVTFVHRMLWSEIVAIGVAREDWQMSGLPAAARKLLTTVEDAGSLRTDNLPKKSKPGELARELERKLLIHAEQVHTEGGAHAKFLETWDRWSERKQFIKADISAHQAKLTIEERLRELNEEFAGTARLPWA